MTSNQKVVWAAIWLLILAGIAQAQAVDGHPDCNLARRAFDSPVSYGTAGGFWAPRYSWHALNAVRSVAATEAIHRAFGISRRKAAFIPPALSIATHLIGYSLGKYGFTWKDWAFDAGVAALPLVLTARNKPVAAATYAAFYSATFCYASP